MVLPDVFEDRLRKFYIGGGWVAPIGTDSFALINPATEEKIGDLALGSSADIDRAVAAAREASTQFACSTIEERRALLRRVIEVYRARREDLAQALTLEMGAPLSRSRNYQTLIGLTHLEEMLGVLERYPFEERRAGSVIFREPIGVCALITPWNAPIMQVVSKVAPALGAGCSVILKPSEQAPLSAILFTEILHEAGVPAGVFNLVQGDGATVGDALSRHPGIDMVSFTGSTRAGVLVAKAAAETVKRVHQELGGKSANILLDDVDLEDAVSRGVFSCFGNSGQSCIAPDRMLVPAHLYDRAVAIARETAEKVVVGDPTAADTTIGPLVNRAQFEKVHGLIEMGLKEGARLVAGGLDRPEDCPRGFYVRPTVFADVDPSMSIAHQEIFGPVLLMMRYASEDDAVRIANDTVYGLAGYVQSASRERAERIAKRLRAGYVYINYSLPDYSAPFGGYKQSGNGREYGEWGLEAFIEMKSVVGSIRSQQPRPNEVTVSNVPRAPVQRPHVPRR
jgi:aldehyde dehydrogenase (NAD+)